MNRKRPLDFGCKSVFACDKLIGKIMEDQKAIEVLKGLLEKHPLTAEEKEAVMAAIGVLSWTTLAKSRIKTQRAKRDKSTEW